MAENEKNTPHHYDGGRDVILLRVKDLEERAILPEDIGSQSTLNSMPAYQYLPTDSDEDAKTQQFEDPWIECSGYRVSRPKLLLYYISNIFLLGLPYLIGRWYCQWKVHFKCVPAPLRCATVVIIKDVDGKFDVCDVVEEPIHIKMNEISQNESSVLSRSTLKKNMESLLHSYPVLRNFEYHREKYVWDSVQKQYRRIDGLEGYTCTDLLTHFQGLTSSKLDYMRKVYGANVLDVPIISYWKLCIDEVLNPFYIFQCFSVGLWISDDYTVYAGCVLLISGISIAFSLRETRAQQVKVHEMAEGDKTKLITVRRSGGEETEINSKDLVPGDVILIPPQAPQGYKMDCDAVLINGTCIVNESMLTGESIPVHKVALLPSDEMYDSDKFKRHTLFAGTTVVQTRYYGGNKVACVVIRTGFNTQKGSLIRSIMYPKEINLGFYRDALKFVQILFLIASCGMAWAIFLYIRRGASFRVILVRVLDIVTIVVPPALPAAMTIGVVYAQSRLKKKKIFCISPARINFCGQINLICFDKTGTLTEEGLDLWCVVPCDENASRFSEAEADPSNLHSTSPLLRGMASCHSLTHINGVLVGDPLDLKMFASTKWELHEPHAQETRRFDLLEPNIVKFGDTELGILREFEFTPHLQRMSVVIRTLEPSGMFLYCKGSPEKVSRLCRHLPDDYDRVLDSFTVKGYRVLAIGWKPIADLNWHQLHRKKREDLENDMIFGGFLVMQNSLKDATIPVIEELTTAKIRSVMVTGDHLLTAISVARDCGMIPSCDKVVVVHVSEEGEVEFKLAAHHYEAIEAPEENGGIRNETFLSGTNPDLIEDIQLAEHGEEGGSGFKVRGRTLSMQSSGGGEALIDMERLVPIPLVPPTRNIAQTIIDLYESNYHFVITGKSWDLLKEKCPKDLMDKILVKGTVFARMSPDDKMELIQHLQGLGYVVSMCGDGANDCAALKMAHVGVSLSKAEASVAAPFTSNVEDISCIPNLIMEGRCALVTTFGMFRYMALYSLIQFTSVLILYLNFTNFPDAHFLLVDLGITTMIALVLGRTGPFKRIVPKTPKAELVSIQNICSVLAQVILAAILQISAIYWLQQQPWYIPIYKKMANADDIIKLCWETTTIVSVSSFQYLTVCIIFSTGPPYRLRFYTNRLLLLLLTGLGILCTVIAVYPVGIIATLFSLMPLDNTNFHFRLSLLVFPVAGAVIAAVLEKNMKYRYGLPAQLVKLLGRQRKKTIYEETLENLSKDVSWPPIKP